MWSPSPPPRGRRGKWLPPMPLRPRLTAKGACALRRRQYDVDFKSRVAREAVETGNGTVVARRYELAPALVNRWAKSYRSHGDAAFDPKKKRSRSSEDPTQRASEFERENDQLKRLLGEKDLEIAILRDLLKKGNHL